MKLRKTWQYLLILAFSVSLPFIPNVTYAYPSKEFYRDDGHIKDNWNIFRTRASGLDGFFAITHAGFTPIILRESIGEYSDLAWELGTAFTKEFPDYNQRAEMIFKFVRDRVIYTSDSDQFNVEEFAQNADEMALGIADSGITKGDCEDSAILLAIMFKAAGYRSAMVLMPGHVATLVYLPQYRKAPRTLNLEGEPGWVWAEATGSTNPLGWIPDNLLDNKIIAKEVTVSDLDEQQNTTVVNITATPVRGGTTGISGSGLFTSVGAIAFLWAITLRKR